MNRYLKRLIALAAILLGATGALAGPLVGFTTGSNNAVGNSALISNTTGIQNTATGGSALDFNTTGRHNTANGYWALKSNTTSSFNTATGYTALMSNITGGGNTATGASALFSNTTASQNTAAGQSALFSNTTGSNNTANGAWALYSNTFGSFNTANGHQALFNNTTGGNNTANGVSALYSNTTGSNNTAIGQSSGVNNLFGSSNVFLGFEAGFNETGSNKLYIANNRTAPLIYGDFVTKRVGIGNVAPTVPLEVTGTVKATAFVGNGAGLTNLPAPAPGSVGTAQLANASVTAAKLSGITAADVGAAAAVHGHTAANIAGLGTLAVKNTVSSVDITNGTITNADISATAAIASSKITGLGTLAAKSTVGTADIANASVTAAKLSGITAADVGAASATHMHAAPGVGNTRVGASTLRSNTTGRYNSASGYRALLRNTSGKFNTASGSNTMLLNTTGSNNTASGYGGLFNNRTGSNNTATGYLTLFNNRTGRNNTVNGAYALSRLRTGSNNTSLGMFAGRLNVAGSNNVFLGMMAGYTELGSNKLYIANNKRTPLIYGQFSAVASRNKLGIGTKVVGAGDAIKVWNGARLSKGGVWTNASSRALKKNIHNLKASEAELALDQLTPVRYRYKNSPDEEYVGFIAEDVPELVAMKDRRSLAAMDIVAVLTKVTKAQKVQLSTQKEQLSDQKAQIAELQEKSETVALLEAENAKLSARQTALEGKLEMLVRASAAGSLAMAESSQLPQ